MTKEMTMEAKRAKREMLRGFLQEVKKLREQGIVVFYKLEFPEEQK